MAHGNYLVSSLCPNLIREHKTAVSGEKGEIRLIGDDHTKMRWNIVGVRMLMNYNYGTQ